MFQTRGFILRKTVVHTGMTQYVNTGIVLYVFTCM